MASGQVIDPVENSSFFIGVRQDLNQHFNHINNISIWNSTLLLYKLLLIALMIFRLMKMD